MVCALGRRTGVDIRWDQDLPLSLAAKDRISHLGRSGVWNRGGGSGIFSVFSGESGGIALVWIGRNDNRKSGVWTFVFPRTTLGVAAAVEGRYVFSGFCGKPIEKVIKIRYTSR